MEQFDKDSRVIANRNGTYFKAGDTGTVTKVGLMDSEEYLFIKLDTGINVGPSVSSYWNLLPLDSTR